MSARIRRRRASCLAGVVSALLAPVRASAQAEPEEPARVCIEWHAAETAGCPTRSQLLTKIEEVLGRAANVSEVCDEIVDASVSRSGKGWQARLAMRAADGTDLGSRELFSQNPSCGALTDPAALVIALMIENAKQHVRLRVEPHVVVAEPPAEAMRLRALAGASMATGLLNALAVGPELGFATLLTASVSLQLDAAAWFPLSESGGRSGRFWAALGGARACFERSNGEPRVGLCAGARSGILHGSGAGLDYNLSTSRPYAEAELELQGAFPVSNALSLVARVGVGVPLLRPRFVYLEVDGAPSEVHRPAWLVSYLGLGLELGSPARRSLR